MYNLQDQLHSIKLYIIWQIEKVTKLQNVIKQFALQGFLPLFFFHKGKLAVKKESIKYINSKLIGSIASLRALMSVRSLHHRLVGLSVQKLSKCNKQNEVLQ